MREVDGRIHDLAGWWTDKILNGEWNWMKKK
jgi:hypothetical protein